MLKVFLFDRYLCTLQNEALKEIDKSFAEMLGFVLITFNIAFSYSFKPLSTPLIAPLIAPFFYNFMSKITKNP